MENHLGQENVSKGAVAKNKVMPDEMGPCTLCKSKSVCKCQRCGDFYCSPQCQRKDWPSHRYICFPMPSLVKASHWSPQKENVIFEDKTPILHTEMANKNIQIPQEKQANTEETPSKGIKIPSSNSCVFLTGFKSTNRCYIRSTNPSDEENFKKVLKEIDEFGKTAPVLSVKPHINSYALVKREGKWCRVQIIRFNRDKRVQVQFVDYGDITKKHQTDLRQINSHIIHLPCYVHMIQLKQINVVSFEKEIMEPLSKYCNQEYKLVFEKDKDAVSGTNAELFNWKTKVLLNTEINKLCNKLNSKTKDVNVDATSNVSDLSNGTESKKAVEKPTTSKDDKYPTSPNTATNTTNGKIENGTKTSLRVPSIIAKREKPKQANQVQAVKPCLEPPFQICPLTENDGNSKIIITDNSYAEMGYIGCILEHYCEKLKEVTTFLKTYRINDEPYKPKINEFCLAEFENDWYRAKVVEIISDDKYQVVYIDFTNEMELTSKSIRHYPISLTVPCHTTLCAIDGLPEDISDELKDLLKSECAAFEELHIDNVRKEEDIIYIECKELLRKLQERKLL